MCEKNNSIIPITLKKHGIFGIENIKKHYFVEEKWMPEDKITQNQIVNDVLEKYNRFRNMSLKSETFKRWKEVNKVKLEYSNGLQRLKRALHDNQLQKPSTNVQVNSVNENMDHRTFIKRKERDRLMYTKQQLTETYESKIEELSKLQDQSVIEKEFPIQAELQARKCHLNLKNSETKLLAFKNIRLGYTQVVEALMKDKIYYDFVLNSLQEDIDEQAAFIRQITQIGQPAKKNLKRMRKEFKKFERDISKQLRHRVWTLNAYRMQASLTRSQARNFVRRSSDFEIDLHRYDRLTQSMTELRYKLDNVSKIMSKLKIATFSSKSEDVSSRVVNQNTEISKQEKRLKNREIEKSHIQEKAKLAETLRDSLKYRTETQDIELHQKLKLLNDEISAEEQIQDECEQYIEKRQDILSNLRHSLHQFHDILQHIGEPISAPEAVELAPPLPKQLDKDAQKMMKALKEQIVLLMNVYQSQTQYNEFEKGKGNYRAGHLRNIYDHEEHSDEEDAEAEDLLQAYDMGDPRVPSRKQIKATSAKILQQWAK